MRSWGGEQRLNLLCFHSDAFWLLGIPEELLNDVVELGICSERAVIFCKDGMHVLFHNDYIFTLV